MNFKDLKRITSSYFNKLLNSINRLIRDKKITINKEYSFTNILRIAESPNHYILELNGSLKYNPYQKISIKVPNRPEKVQSTSAFFVYGNKIKDNMSSVVSISGKNNGLLGGLLITDADIEIVKKKLNMELKTVIIRNSSAEIPIAIKPSVNFLYLIDVDLISTDNFRILYRTIPFAFIIKKTKIEQELIQWLDELVYELLYKRGNSPIPIGINFFYPNLHTFSKQLISLSNQNIAEKIIDNFIQNNTDYFAKALDYVESLPQIELKWVERRNNDPDSSIPDFLMKRKTGFYDILDLKTGAIKYKSITRYKKVGKRGKARLRFNNYVSELIAQLKDYERYFNSEKNLEWAKNKFGIKIKDMKLIGIVGNYNNFDRMEVDIALEQYKDNIIIMSYSDLINLLKLNSKTNNN